MEFPNERMTWSDSDGWKPKWSLMAMTDKQFKNYLVKELSKNPNGMDGLYQVNGQWRSEHLDAAQAA